MNNLSAILNILQPTAFIVVKQDGNNDPKRRNPEEEPPQPSLHNAPLSNTVATGFLLKQRKVAGATSTAFVAEEYQIMAFACDKNIFCRRSGELPHCPLLYCLLPRMSSKSIFFSDLAWLQKVIIIVVQIFHCVLDVAK